MLNRRELLTLFCILTFFMTVTTPVWGMSRKPPEPAYVPGQVLIKFHNDVSRGRIDEIVREEKGSIRSVLRRSGLHQVILPEGIKVMDAVSRFNNYPEVQYAEPNFKAEPLEKE